MSWEPHPPEALAARYQNQGWLVRRWRDRYLALVPWIAMRGWWAVPRGSREFGDSFADCWSLARGIVDGKRDWWFTAEEVFGDE